MKDESPDTSRARALPAWPSPHAAWYAVAVLLLAYTIGFVDRAILTTLVEPIQADLHINDTQLGLLNGFAFVIFYVTLGVPLGLLADRTNRKWLITGSIALWSLMSMACGVASSYTQLFLTRVGVGIGEAGLSPASYSLIADYFPPEKRSAALGVYNLGIFVGSGLALLGGGAVVALIGARPYIAVPLLGALRSWQVVFLAVGAPGLIAAAIACTVREPARRLEKGAAAISDFRAEWARTWRHILSRPKVYLLHTIGFGFLGVPFNVTVLWARPYLSRHFGMAPSHAAYLVGLILVIAAGIGITAGSRVSDELQARGHVDATIRVGLGAALILLGWVIALPFMPTLTGALVVLSGTMFFGAFSYGAAPAALQLITPNRMRAMTSALYLVLVNLVGLMAGPVITGALTDYVFRSPGAVGFSGAIVSATSVMIAAIAFAALRKPFRAAGRALCILKHRSRHDNALHQRHRKRLPHLHSAGRAGACL